MSSDEWRQRLYRRQQQNTFWDGFNGWKWIFMVFCFICCEKLIRVTHRNTLTVPRRQSDRFYGQTACHAIWNCIPYAQIVQIPSIVYAHNPLQFHLIILILFVWNYLRKTVECGHHTHWPIIRLIGCISYLRAHVQQIDWNLHSIHISFGFFFAEWSFHWNRSCVARKPIAKFIEYILQ